MAGRDYAAEAARTSTAVLRRVLAQLPAQALAQRHAILAELRARGAGAVFTDPVVARRRGE